MAAALVGLRVFTVSQLPSPAPFDSPNRHQSFGFRCRQQGGRWKAMVQQQTYLGPSANYAKEMERLSAKECLLLALKDAGGFESLVSGRTTEVQRIDVNERVVGLERLNPTPRPTTSPFLEGRWNFEWFGAGSPGLFVARLLFERSPPTFANLIGLQTLVKDGYSKVTANLKFLDSIEDKFLVTTRLSVEGPTRMKEDYVEVVIEAPTISEQAVPEQLKSALGQATTALEQLPAPIKDAFANGLKLPLNGVFQRLFMISYLDEEILITRDPSGAPEVLTRLDGPPAIDTEPVFPEYES
ncbi:putative plastid-lipid-associated protein 13, chloroplastic [Apostasia shenzhenica]|uniref:Putative plastid-lipid-associated protein 13, chloroplastic n=1 Tax=Apostasia shenzhenica TaxID=1088818 RepID=A0A2I0BH06_9ASPA|nr:putative plastid-lipid-associated protein 13, chloroplastic [Apostasia shenzhenica]